jgi:hypothetical protein
LAYQRLELATVLGCPSSRVSLCDGLMTNAHVLGMSTPMESGSAGCALRSGLVMPAVSLADLAARTTISCACKTDGTTMILTG